MRIALFGGTFDPVHNAHLAVAKEACGSFALDEVWFIPNAIPPHKENGATAPWHHRFRMVELACRVDDRFRASRLEESNQTSYTIQTLETVRAMLSPEDAIFFLIGADAFAEIGMWYRRDDVFRMVEFIVVSRPGHRYNVPQGARIHRLETLQMDVSSTEIRQRLEAGDCDVPVPEEVLAYVVENGVYKV